MCKEKNHRRARGDLVAKDASMLLRVWQKGEELQQVAAAAGLLK